MNIIHVLAVISWQQNYRWCFQSVATTESAGMVQWELIGCWFSLSGGIYEYGHAGIEGEGGVVKKVSADQ